MPYASRLFNTSIELIENAERGSFFGNFLFFMLVSYFSNMKFLSYVSDKYTCLFDWAIVYL